MYRWKSCRTASGVCFILHLNQGNANFSCAWKLIVVEVVLDPSALPTFCRHIIQWGNALSFCPHNLIPLILFSTVKQFGDVAIKIKINTYRKNEKLKTDFHCSYEII